ncbi:Protein tumorous imaginal discs, mitochondrial, partial [Fragariocoptes setiger]
MAIAITSSPVIRNKAFHVFSYLKFNTRTLFLSPKFCKDYYEVLGIPRNASAKDIKKAFYDKAKRYHPDTNKDDPEAAKKFQEVSQAYEVLSDDKRRKEYDFMGNAGAGSRPNGPGGGSTFHRQDNYGSFTDPEQLFRQIFRQFEETYGKGGIDYETDDSNAWGVGRSQEITLNVTFKEAATGCNKEVDINLVDTCPICNGNCCKPGYKPIKCPMCQGTGMETISTGPFMMRTTCRTCKGTRMYIRDPCTECKGKGRTLQRKTVIVPVPAGVDDGQTIRMRIANDKELFVTFRVSKSNYFRRDGADIHTDAVINVSKAVCGGKMLIEGLYDDVTVDISPGTSSHTRIRLPSKGVKRMDSYGRGDHYVHIKIQVPQSPNTRQKELARQLDGIDGIKTNTGGSKSGSNKTTSTSTDPEKGEQQDDSNPFVRMIKNLKCSREKEKVENK